ncbi:hypothetical protein [Nocardia sp. NPDC049149]|uniref:hypothetical protein n=1 Tax=Nocardia sp. NPDC049149 TaxID=3364315 RepID=UPI0037178249
MTACRDLLPKDRAVECVVIGDNADGDQLVFHPCRPQRLFILPRDDEEVVEAGTDLLTAVDTLRLDDPLDELTFEPWDSRTLGTSLRGPADDPQDNRWTTSSP